MKFFRLLVVIFLLAGLQVQIVQADPDSPQGQASSIYLPIISAQTGINWFGPDGGSVLGLVVDPRNENIVYAGTYGAGVFKSIDGGQTWFTVNTGLANPKIQSLAIDPVNPDTLYAGSYRDDRGTHYEGIYKTTNGGQSWFMSSNNLQPSVIVYSIAINPHNTNQIYIATRGVSHSPAWNGKVYRSDDAGTTWNELIGMSNVGGVEDWAYSITINPSDPRWVFAVTHEHGGCFSMDSGATWTNSTDGLPLSDPPKVNGRSIVVDPGLGQTPSVYISTYDGPLGVYYSEDGGNYWTARKNGLGDNWVYGLTLDSQNPANLFAATFTNGIYKSTDSARNWSYSGLGIDKVWIVALAPSNPQTVYAGTMGDGVYKSIDGGATWSHSAAGLQNTWVNALVVVPGSPLDQYAAVSGGGVFHSRDGGQTWEEFNNGLPDLFVNDLVINSSGTMLFALTDTAGLFKTTPGSGFWSQTTPALPITTDQAPLYPEGHPLADQELLETTEQNPDQADQVPETAVPSTISLIGIETAPSNPKIMYLGTKGGENCTICGVYRSSDGGRNWDFRNLAGLTIFNLVVSPSNPDLVYAASSQSDALQVSADGGITWNEIPLAGRTIYSLLIPPEDPGLVYAGTDDGLYTWNGSGWTAKGLSGYSISALSAVPGAAGKIIAGTANGVFISTDAGASWNPGPAELNWMAISSIQVEPVSGYVYYGTTTQGILRAPIP